MSSGSQGAALFCTEPQCAIGVPDFEALLGALLHNFDHLVVGGLKPPHLPQQHHTLELDPPVGQDWQVPYQGLVSEHLLEYSLQS